MGGLLCQHFDLGYATKAQENPSDNHCSGVSLGPPPVTLLKSVTELNQALYIQRTKVESHAETFESQPAPSSADASHLNGISFTAPPVKEWLQSLPGVPEEDRVTEALAKGIAERGELPVHTPTPPSQDSTRRVVELSASLANLQLHLELERQKLGAQHSELARREEEVRKQELRLEAERKEQQDREEALRNYPPPPWLKDGVQGTMNIGVVGNSGVGKSLFVNRLRGVLPGTEGWAPVGVRETTRKISMYAFPNERRVRIWDFPGAGTPEFPFATYISNMGLRYLDCVAIVTAGRFTETELALQTELEGHGVPFCMVRTKVDIDVWNNQQDNGASPEKTVAEIVSDLRSNGVVRPYVVSLRDTSSYDYPTLLTDLLPCLRPDRMGSSLGEGWDDAWAMPPVFSQVTSGIQGRWCDAQGTIYCVHGLQVHVQKTSESNGAVTLNEGVGGKVWWLGRLWIDADAVCLARNRGELRWASKWSASKLKPMVWYWRE